MQVRIKWVIFFLLLIFASSLSGQPENIGSRGKLPALWKVRNVVEVSEDNLGQFRERLGGNITELKNYFLNANGIRIQVNVIKAGTDQDAENIYQSLMASGGTQNFYQRVGNTCIEYICPNAQIIKKAMDIIGLQETPVVKWKVSLLVAPLNQIDYMQWNELFNRLKLCLDNPDEPGIDNIMNWTAENFSFGEDLFLRNAKCQWGSPEYTYVIPPVSQQESSDIVNLQFVNSIRQYGIPQIAIEAIIPVKAFAPYMPKERIDPDALTDATQFWPVDDTTIKATVDSIIGDSMSTGREVEAILGWINQNLQFSGSETGSRYGCIQVMDQGYGHCWDYTDVFITLCRAADIPARQVCGWLNGVSGHVWAEVYIEDIGWVSVDPTTSWLGVSEDYIPFVISEDGRMPFVYWNTPVIERIEE
jgi:hypothetical protein